MILVAIATGLSKASPQLKKEKRRKGREEKTMGIKCSLYGGQDIGEDSGSPVDFTYTPPFLFTASLTKSLSNSNESRSFGGEATDLEA